MPSQVRSRIPAGRRLAGYALGALLQTPLYVMFAFLVAGLANEFLGDGMINGIKLIRDVDNATFAATGAGVFVALVMVAALIAPRALAQRGRKGESETPRKQSAAPFGAVFADDALSTREKLAFVLSTFPGVMQAAAFVLLAIAMGIGRVAP
jgi:hypothetical protein